MAINKPATSPISSIKSSLAAIDVSYLAAALGFPENDLRTVRGEGADIAFRIAHMHVKSADGSLNQLRAEKNYRAGVGSSDDPVSRRYFELAARYVELHGICGALQLARDAVSESRIGESLKRQVKG